MKKLNKPRLLLCLVISTALNIYWYLDNRNDQERLSRLGIITTAYIKDITKESSLSMKFKYTKVASMFFITQKGDSIWGITKNLWAMKVKELQDFNFYLPLDSVIYNKNNPNDFQRLSDYRNYSETFSIIAYFFFGIPFCTVWGYGLFFGLNKIYIRIRTRNWGAISIK